MKIINQKAFTLIEITFLLVIFGLLMGSLLAPISAIVYQYNINYTENQLEEIKEALLGFAVLHKRLPCPDTDDTDDTDDNGKENNPCIITNIEGDLPWATLGVGKNDVWGNAFRYRVDKNYTEKMDISSSLRTDENKKLKVRRDDTPSTFLTTLDEKNLSRVVAIIFSKGRNAKADDGNDDTNATYVQDFKLDENNEFDDHLTWLSKQTVMYQLIAAKQWFP